MIFVIDKAVTNDIHVVFNSSLLRIIKLAFPDEIIQFISDGKHGEFVQNALKGNSSNITYSAIKNKTSHSKGLKRFFEWIGKVIDDFFFFKSLFQKAKGSPNSRLILNIPPISFILFKLIKLIYPKQKVYLILHGELEYLYFSNGLREKGLGFFYRMMFWIKGKNVKYILLNKIAKAHLVKDKFIKAEQAIEIHHPYLFDTNIVASNLEFATTLQFANIGSLIPRKNGGEIFRLSGLLKDCIIDGKLVIRTIGMVDSSLAVLDNNLVEGIKASNKSMDRFEFESKVNAIHFALFFFDENQFIFRASGALMDAFNFCKPIIALRHPFFSSMFDEYGKLGYLCDNVDEMALLIKEIATNKVAFGVEYSGFIQNIKSLKENLSLESIAQDFKMQDDEN
jgi:hypothetical protein